jgi:hypothetical protein
MNSIHTTRIILNNYLEFFELVFNSLVVFVKKNRLSCWDFT